MSEIKHVEFDRFDVNRVEAKGKNDDIISQRIGSLFDGVIEQIKQPAFSIRIKRCFRIFQNFYYSIKWSIRNHIKWHKVLTHIRPWEGYEGLIEVMMYHLKDYVIYERNYGIGSSEYKQDKISSVVRALELLNKLEEPHDYAISRISAIADKYPSFKHLINLYNNGTLESIGLFISYGSGWVGIEDYEKGLYGYYEIVDNILKRVSIVDNDETNKLINDILEYNKYNDQAYIEAEKEINKDFDELYHIFKDNLYSWWN